jgi:UDP:flavonoid glycosyltransferase YjiC (YdhE family)
MKTLTEADVQPLDLLLFRGVDPVSRAIQFMQRRKIGRGDYSHAGLAITRDVLDLPCLEPDKTYVWESVLSASEGFWASHTDKVPAVDAEGVRFGVQLRDLELVVPGYMSDGGRVSWCSFRGQRPPIDEIRDTLKRLHEQYGHASYTKNLLNVFATVFPELRSARDRMNRLQDRATDLANRLLRRAGKASYVLDAEHHVFCSEWVARVYAALGIFEVRDPRLAAPVHFLTRTGLFAEPEQLVPEGFDEAASGAPAILRTRGGTGPGVERARSVEAAFLRHRSLREQLHGYADECQKTVSVSEDSRVTIGFGAEKSAREDDPERWLEEDATLDLRRPRAPLAIGVEPQDLQIAILVAGSQREVRPFLAIGRRLAQDGHRVRLATHADMREFVESSGLEFYPLAGNSHDLTTRLTRGKGSHASERRRLIADLIDSTSGACTEQDPERPDAERFSADAIIANPALRAHVHLAEALRVPLQMISTTPWSPTRAFPHPLANVGSGSARGVNNWLSYDVVDKLMWRDAAEPIARLRKRLELPRLRRSEGPDLINERLVPFCYLWSPHLLPRPDDWGDHVDIGDFLPVDLDADFEPPAELAAFLESGDPPVYVGFGTDAADAPPSLWSTVFDALKAAGRRGVIAAPRGEVGGVVPEHVCLVGECPEEWLFARCAAVCHHGEPSTTATGLAAGRPTVVVPFVGHQAFWGATVARAGAGPEPIPIPDLNVDRLTDAFRACEAPEVRSRAAELGTELGIRDGAALAVKAFYRHLPTTADGLLSYLGFDAHERRRLGAGEVLTHDLRAGPEFGEGFVLAARIDRPMEDIYASCLAGKTVERNPTVREFGVLPASGATLADFARTGYGADETDEVAALLRASPSSPFNLSAGELEKLEALHSRFPDPAGTHGAVDAVNEALQALLHERYRDYAAHGLSGIAPYVREKGEKTRPDELLRCALPPDSIVMEELPDFRRVLLEYPQTKPGIEHRFYWTKQELAGRPTFSLVHHLLRIGDGMALMVARSYYVSRGLDVLQILAGLVPDGEGTLFLCSHRVSASQASGTWLRPERRSLQRQILDAATQIALALREEPAAPEA